MRLVIGNATLYLGDAYELLPVIGAVDAMVTDPPYLIKTSGGGKFRKQRSLMERIDALGITNGFDHSIFKPELYGSIVTFCHNDQLHILLPYLANAYNRHAVLPWGKTNPIPFANKNYKADVEYYIHAWNKGYHPQGEPSELSRMIVTPVIKSTYNHPTVKPDIVMNKIIHNVAGETIIDPFMGTGSTGIAAIKAGKKFVGIENNPDVFNIACQRFFELLGNV